MSKIRVELENMVFYRKLTNPEWKHLRGYANNEFLLRCITRLDYSIFIRNWLKNSGVL